MEFNKDDNGQICVYTPDGDNCGSAAGPDIHTWSNVTFLFIDILIEHVLIPAIIDISWQGLNMSFFLCRCLCWNK